MSVIVRLLTFTGMLGLGFIVLPLAVSAASVNPPVILEDRDLGGEYIDRPLIIGLNPANTEVLIYMNGEYQGLAWVNEGQTGTDNFYFQPVSPWPQGQHVVWAIARDKTSLLLSPISEAHHIEIRPLPAPTMVEPNEQTVTAKVKPLITGLSRSDTKVHVYIDGVYNGSTGLLRHESGTADFIYAPFLNLSVGQHYLWTVAEDSYGRRSAPSRTVYFKIEEPFPAPVLRQPAQNGSGYDNQPLISGVVPSGSLVKVFINHVLDGQFYADSVDSRAAGFAYRPFGRLPEGNNLIYTTATDERGKESQWSNIVRFSVVRQLVAASETNNDLETKTDDTDQTPIVVPGEEGDVSDIDSSENLEEGVLDSDIQDIIEAPITEEQSQTGSVDEGRENQGKLKLNLLIFIAFLLGVIGWIFWVNRELIKERQIKNTSGDNK